MVANQKNSVNAILFDADAVNSFIFTSIIDLYNRFHTYVYSKVSYFSDIYIFILI